MTLDERLDLYLEKTPSIADSAFVAASAVVIGDVRLAEHASVWPLCVLRGDIQSIVVGEGSNVQDGSIVHLANDFGVRIGRYVTVGHGAMIHACTIEDECLIGMRATVLDGAVIGAGSIVGAGAVVTKGMQVPPNSVVMGLPGKVVKTLTDEERQANRRLAEKYIHVAARHKAKCLGHPQGYSY